MKESIEKINTGKIPPQNIEAEVAVLGAILIDRNALVKVLPVLSSNMFYKEAHVKIFNAITSLFSRGESIDLLTLSTELRKKGELDLVGGLEYINGLTDSVSSSANLEFWARIIMELSIKRNLIKIATQALQDSFDEKLDAFYVLESMQGELLNTSRSIIGGGSKNLKELIGPVLTEIQESSKNNGQLTGIPSGFNAIDSLTGGWKKGNLIILAARPSMGKTTLAVNFATNAFKIGGHISMIFSMEQTNSELVKKILSAESGIKSSSMDKGNVTEYDISHISDVAMGVYTEKILIDDAPAQSIMQIRSKAMNAKMSTGLDLVIIDYLQLAKGEGKMNREQEVASISRGFKAMAKELNIPVIALAQLSRACEDRGGDKKPMLSDLRESGSIEQDADIVAFVYRAEYYGFTEDEAGNSTTNTAELIFAKHRGGATVPVQLGTNLALNKFTDL